MKQTWPTLLNSVGSGAQHNWVLLLAGPNYIGSCWAEEPNKVESGRTTRTKNVGSSSVERANVIGSSYTAKPKSIVIFKNIFKKKYIEIIFLFCKIYFLYHHLKYLRYIGNILKEKKITEKEISCQCIGHYSIMLYSWCYSRKYFV